VPGVCCAFSEGSSDDVDAPAGTGNASNAGAAGAADATAAAVTAVLVGAATGESQDSMCLMRFGGGPLSSVSELRL